MIPTKPSPSEATGSKTAFVIGIGDGKATRLLEQRKLGFDRYFTVVLPGEEIVPVPGLVFKADRPTAIAELISIAYPSHAAMVTMVDSAFFDQHPISVDEKIRADFCKDFYRILGDKPLEFGDDILDGMQGAFHIAKNAPKLLRCATPDSFPRMTCPAIAVAAGPSLQRHIPTIRALQNKCLIIACDSLLDGLLAEGIRPHLVTPVERIPEIAKAFSSTGYNPIFCGKPVVHPDVVDKFANHLFVPCTDIIYTWCGGKAPDLVCYGQSTGTMAVAMACQMTSGPVYLAGHDLSMAGDKSHWKDAKAVQVHGHETFPTKGYSGEVYTDWWWDMFKRQIEATSWRHGNVINLNALDGIGAVIAHTHSGSLPHPDDLPAFTFPELPPPNEARYQNFRTLVRNLPKDTRGMLTTLNRGGLSKRDLDLKSLCPTDNWQMWAYVLRSLIAQFSYESHANKSDKVVVAGLVDAYRNVLTQLLPMCEEMAASCV